MNWIWKIGWAAFFVALAISGLALVNYVNARNDLTEIYSRIYEPKTDEVGRLYYETSGNSNAQASYARVTERDSDGNIYEINLETGQKTRLQPSDLELQEWSTYDRMHTWSMIMVFSVCAAVGLLIVGSGIQIARRFL